jgi:hypothetical protein
MNSFKVASLISFDSATKNCQEEGRDPPEVCHSTKSAERGKEVFRFKIIWTLRRSASHALRINGVDAMAILSSNRVGVALSTDCNGEGNKKKRGTTKRPRSTKKMFSML